MVSAWLIPVLLVSILLGVDTTSNVNDTFLHPSQSLKAARVSAHFHCSAYDWISARECISLDWTPGSSGVATAKYEWEEGWAKLWVRTRPTVEAELAMFAAGYLEGYLMKKDIQQMFINTYGDWFSTPVSEANGFSHPSSDSNAAAVRDWLGKNAAWTRKQAAASGSDFWYGVKLVMAQLDGLAAGLQAAGSWLTLQDMVLLNADGDLEDLVPLLSSKRMRKRDRCSALVKVAADRSDIFFGHTTWDHFDMMVRSLKVYDFELKDRPRYKVSFSSSPGFLSSLDDFFLTSNGLAVIETTNGINNTKLWPSISESSVLSWVRVSVANMLAKDGPTWAKLFATANSGTYNDQWMILDMKKFSPGKALPPASFVVLEQVPGHIEWHDMTKNLNSDGYWGSYNIPAFASIRNTSGLPHPNSHDTAPRALIFKEQQATITSLDSFQRVIRYNDWQHDPLSLGNACNAVSSRCDLNPIGSSTWQLEGGIDAKASSVTMGMSLKFVAQNGPTADEQPPFTWEAIPAHLSLPHQGQPDLFNYSWIAFGPTAEFDKSSGSKAVRAIKVPLLIVAVFFSLIMLCRMGKSEQKSVASAREPLLA